MTKTRDKDIGTSTNIFGTSTIGIEKRFLVTEIEYADGWNGQK
jgi:hypothetical protein